MDAAPMWGDVKQVGDSVVLVLRLWIMVALKGHVRAKVALGCRWVHGCIAFIKPKNDRNSSTFTFISVTIIEDMAY